MASEEEKPVEKPIKREDYPSKSAYNKALRRALKLKTKMMKKKQRKEDKAARSAIIREERKKRIESMSKEELEKYLAEKKQKIRERKEAAELRKKRLEKASTSENIVVVDLDFGEYMRPDECKSLALQLQYCYSSNARVDEPCRLTFTGLDGIMGEELAKTAGVERWPVVKEDKSYIEVFKDRKQDLVYLTADSENVLEEFDSSKIYIIGGIVDRNRHKGICKKKAEEQGIQTAQLPILKHVRLLSSTVLTVNQVFEIYLQFQKLKDWKEALKIAIPSRKVCEKKEEDGGDDKENNKNDTEQ